MGVAWPAWLETVKASPAGVAGGILGVLEGTSGARAAGVIGLICFKSTAWRRPVLEPCCLEIEECVIRDVATTDASRCDGEEWVPPKEGSM